MVGGTRRAALWQRFQPDNPEGHMRDIRARLQKERDDALARLRELGLVVRESAPGADGTDPARDLADHVQASTRRDLGFIARERLAGRVARLNAALARLADGTYGLCVLCGEEVAPARLRAIPEADTCRDCQEKLERQAAA